MAVAADPSKVHQNRQGCVLGPGAERKLSLHPKVTTDLDMVLNVIRPRGNADPNLTPSSLAGEMRQKQVLN